MTWSMRRYLPGLLLLFVLPSAARAQKPPVAVKESITEQARSHLRSGVAYYDAARYEDAAREMEEAYRLKPLPDLQYNLAQCYERLGRTADAIAAYKSYVAGKPDAEDKGEVATRVANLEQRLAQGPGGTGTPDASAVKERIVLKEVVVYKEAPPKPGRGLRAASYVVGAIAVAALAGGITFSVLAHRDASQVTSGGNPAMPVGFDGMPAQTQDAGHQDQVLAFVGYGIAAVGAVGAAALYVLGDKVDKETAKQLALGPAAPGRPAFAALPALPIVAPTVFAHGAGLGLQGSF